jgi:histidinol dehydrogenase
MTTAISTSLAVSGPAASLSDAKRRLLFDRSTSCDDDVRRTTGKIIERVRRDGDGALRQLAREYDGAVLDSLEVPRAIRRRALDGIGADLRRAMERLARNLAAVNAPNMPTTTTTSPEPGLTVVRRPDPLARVGVYAPGGRAAYPSSVRMSAVPARLAGVAEIVSCSPPTPSGMPSDIVLAAAEIAGVDRVFAIGGAGAVAAMAFGTESVPRVDRVVGPGNAFVVEAKLQLCGQVGVDLPAGPSELLVIADESCDPKGVALELLAQAEHDPSACVTAVVIGEATAARIVAAIADGIEDQPRRDVIARALERNGAVVWTDSLAGAVAFANEYASEHVLVCVSEASDVVPFLRSAGTVFVGGSTSVSFGDYMSGANHVLPTGGLARSYSGLSIADFFRWTTIQTATPAAATALAGDVALFAEAEGLAAHAMAARYAGGFAAAPGASR